MGIVYEGENTYTDSSKFDKVKVVPPGKVLYKEGNPTGSVYFQNQRTTKNGIAIETETGWHLVDIEEYLQSFAGSLDEETLRKIGKIYGIDVSSYLSQKPEVLEKEVEELQELQQIEEPKEEVLEKVEEDEEEKEQLAEQITEYISEETEKLIEELEEQLEDIEIDFEDIKEEQLEELAEEQVKSEEDKLKEQILLSILNALYQGQKVSLEEAEILRNQIKDELKENEVIPQEYKDAIYDLLEKIDFRELISLANKTFLQQNLTEEVVRENLPEDILERPKDEIIETIESELSKIKENLILAFEDSLFPKDLEDVLEHLNEIKENILNFFDSDKTLEEEAFEIAVEELENLESEEEREIEEEHFEEIEEESYKAKPEEVIEENLRLLAETEEPLKNYINELSKFFLGIDFSDLNIVKLEEMMRELGAERTLSLLTHFITGLLSLENESFKDNPIATLEYIKAQLSKNSQAIEDLLVDICISNQMNINYMRSSKLNTSEHIISNIKHSKNECEQTMSNIAFIFSSFLPQYESKLIHSYLRTPRTVVANTIKKELNKLKEKTGPLFPYVKPSNRLQILNNIAIIKRQEENKAKLEEQRLKEIQKLQEEELIQRFDLDERYVQYFEGNLKEILQNIIKYAPSSEVFGEENEFHSPLNLSLLLESLQRASDGTLSLFSTERSTRIFNGALYQASNFISEVLSKDKELLQTSLGFYVVEGYEARQITKALFYLTSAYLDCNNEQDCIKLTLLNQFKASLQKLKFLPEELKKINPQSAQFDEEGNLVYSNISPESAKSLIEEFFQGLIDFSSASLAYALFTSQSDNLKGIIDAIYDYRKALFNEEKQVPDEEKPLLVLEFLSDDSVLLSKPLRYLQEGQVIDAEERPQIYEFLENLKNFFGARSGEDTFEQIQLEKANAPYTLETDVFFSALLGALKSGENFSSLFASSVGFENFESFEEDVYKVLTEKYPTSTPPSHLQDEISKQAQAVPVFGEENLSFSFEEEVEGLVNEEEPEEKVDDNILDNVDEFEEFLELSFEDEDTGKLSYPLGSTGKVVFDVGPNGNKVCKFYDGNKYLGSISLSSFDKERGFKEQLIEAYEKLLFDLSPENILNEAIQYLDSVIKTKRKYEKKQARRRKTETQTEKQSFIESEAIEEKTEEIEKEIEEELEKVNEEQSARSDLEIEIENIEKEELEKIKDKVQEKGFYEELKEPEEFEKDYSHTLRSLSLPHTIESLARFLSRAFVGEIDEEFERDIKGLLAFGIFDVNNFSKVQSVALGLYEEVPEIARYVEDFKEAFEKEKNFAKLVNLLRDNIGKEISESTKNTIISYAQKLKDSKNPVIRSVALHALRIFKDSDLEDFKRSLQEKTSSKEYLMLRDYLENDFLKQQDAEYEVFNGVKLSKFDSTIILEINLDDNTIFLPLTETEEQIKRSDLSEKLTFILASLESSSTKVLMKELENFFAAESDYEVGFFDLSIGKKRIGNSFIYYISSGESLQKNYTNFIDFISDTVIFFYNKLDSDKKEEAAESTYENISEDKTPNETEPEYENVKETEEKTSNKKGKSTKTKKTKDKKPKTKEISPKGAKGIKVVIEENEPTEAPESRETKEEVIENVPPNKILTYKVNSVLKRLNLDSSVNVQNDEELLELSDIYAENIEKQKERVEENKRIHYLAEENTILDAVLEFSYQEKPNSELLKKSAKEVIQTYDAEKLKRKLLEQILPKILVAYDVDEEELNERIKDFELPKDIKRYQHKINKNNLNTEFLQDLMTKTKEFLVSLGIEVSDSFVHDEIIRALVN